MAKLTTPTNATDEPDVLIVLGKNIGIQSTQNDIREDSDHLSTDSRINVLAAVESYQPGMTLIFSTGKTSGEDIPSEASAMYNFFKKEFRGELKGKVILEENSIDTATNAAEVSNILKNMSHGRVYLLTVGHHLRNAITLFERNGVTIQKGIISENVVRNSSVSHKKFIDNWALSDRVKKERIKELIRKIGLIVDRKGTLMHLITRHRKM
jgi:uncharacterized SAM-binding protein YcdF (DUF218 family)